MIVANWPGANGFIAIGALRQGDKEGYDLIQLFKKLPSDP